jgi:hypothetical protein
MRYFSFVADLGVDIGRCQRRPKIDPFTMREFQGEFLRSSPHMDVIR